MSDTYVDTYADAYTGGGVDEAEAWFDVTDMPADFEEMWEAEIVVRYRGQNFGSKTITLYAQIFQSNEVTPLTDEEQVAQVSSNGSFTNTSAVAFSGIVASNKTVWDNARLRLRWEIV